MVSTHFHNLVNGDGRFCDTGLTRECRIVLCLMWKRGFLMGFVGLVTRFHLTAVISCVLLGVVAGLLGEASASAPFAMRGSMNLQCEPEPTPPPPPDTCIFCMDNSQCICIEYGYDRQQCVQEYCQGGCECVPSFVPYCGFC